MKRLAFVIANVVVLSPLFLHAAPVPAGVKKPASDARLFQDAKVGDYATYKMTIGIKDQLIHGTLTLTVLTKTEKEVAIESALSIDDMSSSVSKHTIDFTKPFDPSKQLGDSDPNTKFEKLKTGTETLKIAEKENDAVWTSDRVTSKVNDREYSREMKFWRSKSQPGLFVKMEVVCLDGSNTATTLELTETGRKK